MRMSEPGKNAKTALDVLTKFSSSWAVIINGWKAKLHKLVQSKDERMNLQARYEKCSEGIRGISAIVFEKANIVQTSMQSKTASLKENSRKAVSFAGFWAGKHRKPLASGIAAMTLIAVIFAVTYKPIYAVQVDGEIIGYVHEVRELQESFEEVVQELEMEYEQEVMPSQEIEYVKVRGDSVEVADVESVKESLLACVSLETQGYVLMIAGEEVLGIVDQEDAELVFETIKEDYISKHQSRNTIIEEVEIEENVEVVGKSVPICDFMTPEEAADYLMTGGVEKQTYEVVSGDSLWSISKQFSISLDNLKKANPDLKGEKLSIGQKLNLEVVAPYVTIISRERVIETVKIAYSEEVQRDASLWAWERRVAQRGQSGQKEVVYEVVKRNGVVVEKEVKSEKVLQEPVAQIIVRGSKQDSGSLIVGTGRFLWPVQGRITSPYGSRSGGFHTGVDVAAPRNTPIRAADDGTVTVATYSRVGYGNRIEVNHGNGFSTLYAHCNSLAVRQGQTVKKGQIIAYVGSTGRSSGDHLHFEIRINGNHVNPMRYF
jgi:murein DD-endopeptidase MepM/ murein hydrolase activator NlpD